MGRKIDASICQRGQVWYVPEDRETTDRIINDPNNSVTAKSRTYLVISCRENNEMSTTINCLVVSSRPTDGYPMHVPFSFTGRNMMVQCEQIKTFDIREFVRLRAKYNFSLTPVIMERVNMALINQLELNQCIPGYSSIMSMIENIASIKVEEMKKMYQRVTDDEVIEVAAKIESMFKIEKTELIPNVKQNNIPKDENVIMAPMVSENMLKTAYCDSKVSQIQNENTYKPNVHSSKEPIHKSQIDKFNNKYIKDNGFNTVLSSNFKIEIPKETSNEVQKESGRNSWDQQKIKQFLLDCDTKSPEEVAKIYNLKDKKSVYSYKYKFKS
jgi:mRNA-degrading endonuclease toxin of MazEF toxin-antitoxin module